MTQTPDQATPRVLVGVDGSDDGLRATRYAAGRALRKDIDLWLVHALDDGVVAGGWGVIYDPTVLEQAGKAAITQAVEVAVQRGLPRERIHSDVLVGHPAVIMEELSQRAESVVVGRRAASGLERMFVGSTSTSLAATAACPVIVISSASTPGPATTHERIGVAIGSGKSDKGLRWGCQEAARRDTVLEIIHVAPSQSSSALALVSPPSKSEETQRGRLERELEARADALRRDFPQVKIETTCLIGQPSDLLIGRSADLDLLILTVRPRAITGIALGGAVRAVLAHALCPVGLIR